jgi:hypothetical protein
MKPNIPESRSRTDWLPAPRSVLVPVVFILSLALTGLLVMAAKPRAPKVAAAPPKVLMVGDSLSVGKFGEVIRDYLVSTYGEKNVAVYASCGSSPEQWLRAEPIFYTKCGYREQSPGRYTLVDFDHGRRPRMVATPKLEKLIADQRPAVVIVQLGTNWMDRLVTGNPAKEAEIASYLDRFIAAAHAPPRTVRQITWIMPPDSSHFSRRVQGIVETLIRRASVRDHFDVIPSRDLTHYVPGKTGADGVHYNSEASAEWANRVILRLKRKSILAGLSY